MKNSVQTRFIAFPSIPRFIASLFLLSLTLPLKAQDTIPTLRQDSVTTVKIGKQLWMVKNLDVVTFRNGDKIPEAKTNEEWLKAGEEKKPAWCYYNNDPKNGEKYGKLYNWYAVSDSRGIAPKGYHVPSQGEWYGTFGWLKFDDLKSEEGWGYDKNGTNDSKFNALPAGLRATYAFFSAIGFKAVWWSSSEYHENRSYSCEINLNFANYATVTENSLGLSVRCLKD